MRPSLKIKAGSTGRGAEIELDGTKLTHVRSVSVTVDAARPTTATIEIYVADVDLEIHELKLIGSERRKLLSPHGEHEDGAVDLGPAPIFEISGHGTSTRPKR